MATITCQRPVTNFVSLPRRQSENHTMIPSLFQWDESQYDDLALLNSLSCDAINRSPPHSPSSIPRSNRKYAQLSQESNVDREPASSFLPRDFDNWLSDWDDSLDSGLSPTIESPSTTLNSIPLSPDMGTVELQAMASISPETSVDPAIVSNDLSDSSIAFGNSITDEPLFQSSQTLEGITDATLKGLKSTPPFWEQLLLSYRASNPSFYAPLSAAEVSRLRAIAMPPPACPASPASSSSSDSQDTYNFRKRRSSKSSEVECPPVKRSRHSAPRNTAHNMIEKRYRTNLNDKIAALRDSIPSLRVVAKNNSHGEGSQEDLQEDLQGLSPAHKLNKATILSKAIEYIAHIEKRAKCITKENKDLKARVDAFETLLIAQSQNGVTGNRTSQGQYGLEESL